MNLLCPSCQKMITVPDHNAGQITTCPLCAATFTAPSLPTAASERVPVGSNPSSSSPSEIFGLKNEGTSPSAAASPHWESATTGPLPGGYRHEYTIWFSPRVVPWIAPVGLILILVLLLFPWRSLPPVVEDAITNYDITTIPKGEPGIFKIWSNAWLIIYFFLYLITLVLAVGDLLLDMKVITAPPQLKPWLPWRSAITGGVALLALLCLIFGSLSEDFPTFWMGLIVWIQFAVVIGVWLEYCLENRSPDRPLPKIDILW
jgi:hypothetical protein